MADEVNHSRGHALFGGVAEGDVFSSVLVLVLDSPVSNPSAGTQSLSDAPHEISCPNSHKTVQYNPPLVNGKGAETGQSNLFSPLYDFFFLNVGFFAVLVCVK